MRLIDEVIQSMLPEVFGSLAERSIWLEELMNRDVALRCHRCLKFLIQNGLKGAVIMQRGECMIGPFLTCSDSYTLTSCYCGLGLTLCYNELLHLDMYNLLAYAC